MDGRDRDREVGQLNSFDLNPIENVWHVLKTQVRKRRPRVLTREALKVTLMEK